MSKEMTKIYTTEFKQSAVKLANEFDVPIAETARNLGINEIRFTLGLTNTTDQQKLKRKQLKLMLISMMNCSN